jgi:hypothetical protein
LRTIPRSGSGKNLPTARSTVTRTERRTPIRRRCYLFRVDRSLSSATELPDSTATQNPTKVHFGQDTFVSFVPFLTGRNRKRQPARQACAHEHHRESPRAVNCVFRDSMPVDRNVRIPRLRSRPSNATHPPRPLRRVHRRLRKSLQSNRA